MRSATKPRDRSPPIINMERGNPSGIVPRANQVQVTPANTIPAPGDIVRKALAAFVALRKDTRAVEGYVDWLNRAAIYRDWIDDRPETPDAARIAKAKGVCENLPDLPACQKMDQAIRHGWEQPTDTDAAAVMVAAMLDAMPAAKNIESSSLIEGVRLLMDLDEDDPDDRDNRGPYRVSGFAPGVVGFAILEWLGREKFAPGPAELMGLMRKSRRHLRHASDLMSTVYCARLSAEDTLLAAHIIEKFSDYETDLDDEVVF